MKIYPSSSVLILSLRIHRVVPFTGSIIPCDLNRYTVQTADRLVRRYLRTRCRARRSRRRRRGGPWNRACWCTSIGHTAWDPAWAFARTKPLCVTSWRPANITTKNHFARNFSTRRRCRRTAVIQAVGFSGAVGKIRPSLTERPAWAVSTRTVCSPELTK